MQQDGHRRFFQTFLQRLILHNIFLKTTGIKSNYRLIFRKTRKTVVCCMDMYIQINMQESFSNFNEQRGTIQRLLNRWTSQLDLGSTTGCLERVVSVHNST